MLTAALAEKYRWTDREHGPVEKKGSNGVEKSRKWFQ